MFYDWNATAATVCSRKVKPTGKRRAATAALSQHENARLVSEIPRPACGATPESTRGSAIQLMPEGLTQHTRLRLDRLHLDFNGLAQVNLTSLDVWKHLLGNLQHDQ